MHFVIQTGLRYLQSKLAPPQDSSGRQRYHEVARKELPPQSSDKLTRLKAVPRFHVSFFEVVLVLAMSRMARVSDCLELICQCSA